MAFANDIVIADAAAANKTFKLISLTDGNSSRIDSASNLTTPRSMFIKHQIAGSKANGNISDRHLVSFSATYLDGSNKEQTAVLNFTLQVPRSTAVSRTNVNDLIAFLRNWLGVSTNVDGLLINES
jgi:hypothetical protein